MDLDLIKQALASGIGLPLKEYLRKRLEQLRSIESIEEKNTEAEQALEIKAQKRAYGKLKEILQDIITLSESPKSKDPRDSYAVDVDQIKK